MYTELDQNLYVYVFALFNVIEIHKYVSWFQIRRPRKYDYKEHFPLDRRNRKPPLGYEHMIAPKVFRPPTEKLYNYGWE